LGIYVSGEKEGSPDKVNEISAMKHTLITLSVIAAASVTETQTVLHKK
jgi:hypothetical protein